MSNYNWEEDEKGRVMAEMEDEDPSQEEIKEAMRDMMNDIVENPEKIMDEIRGDNDE